MERELVMQLEWNLTPASIETWLNIVLIKWDEYCSNSEYTNVIGSSKIIEVFDVIKENVQQRGRFRLLREMDQLYQIHHTDCYKRYRDLLHVIDTVILDIESIQYKSQAIVMSALFGIIVMDLNILTPKEMIKYEIDRPMSAQESMQQPPRTAMESQITQGIDSTQTQSVMEQTQIEFMSKVERMDEFVQIYSNFLRVYFGISYDDLAPTLEFVCPYSGGVKLAIEACKREAPSDFNLQTLQYTVSIPPFLKIVCNFHIKRLFF